MRIGSANTASIRTDCVGEPLTMFRGVLTGTPAYTGDIDPLLEGRGANRT